MKTGIKRAIHKQTLSIGYGKTACDKDELRKTFFKFALCNVHNVKSY